MRALTSPDLIWLAQGLLVSLTVGLAAALLVGVLLMAKPRLLFALNQRLSRWVDTAERFRALEKPHLWERLYYRHHRILGSLITAGAVYVLWRWTFAYDRSGLLALLDPRWVTNELDWIVAALESALVALHGLILVAGLVILFRPSLLKNLEHTANRWQSGPATTRLDAVIGSLDRGFEVYPRLSGLLLIVASVWCLTGLIPVLARTFGG